MSATPDQDQQDLFRRFDHAPEEARPRRVAPGRPPGHVCEILLFPLYRQLDLVDQIRRELFPPLEQRRDDDDPEALFRTTFAREAEHLRARGLSKRDAYEEVNLLMDAAARMAGDLRRQEEGRGHT